MTIITIAEVPDGDWKAIYIDNDLFDQNHSFHLMDLLPALTGKTIEAVEHFFIEAEGRFPDKLSDIKRE